MGDIHQHFPRSMITTDESNRLLQWTYPRLRVWHIAWVWISLELLTHLLPVSILLTSARLSWGSHSVLEAVGELLPGSPGTTLVSPVCQPNFQPNDRRIRRIFFMHMRKAGGTTIGSYLEKVARHYNLTLDVAEASKIELPGSQSDTLYVTHLRHPVKRVLSHFKYEGRWPCKQLMRNKTYVPTLENARDTQDWVDENKCGKRSQTLWLCSTNCYIQWLNFGYPKGRCNADDIMGTPQRKSQAIATALKFNIILDVERLFQSEEYGYQVEKYFGVPGLVGYNRGMYCGKASAAANKMHPLLLSNDTMTNLNKLNAKDLDLFQTLTTCDGPVLFPSFSLADFVLDDEQ